jgi:hypothetical protein
LGLAGEGFALLSEIDDRRQRGDEGGIGPIHRADLIQQLLEGIRKLEAIGDRLEIGDDLVGDLGQSAHCRPPVGRATTAGMILLRSLRGSVAFVGSEADFVGGQCRNRGRAACRRVRYS